MSSRLIAELELQAKNAKDRVAWSRALCRISIHRARQGQFESANEYIQSIRKVYGVELQYEVASWVMLAEGVLHFSKAEMYQAYDRLRRAYGLAVAFKTESARPSCAAWMALMEFNASKYDEMALHIDEVLRDAGETDHQARGRACLVLADSLQLAGSFELAKVWYERTRLHATAEGDQAMLSAMLYNVAVVRTSNLRLADTFDEVNAAELKRASMEANSSFTYDMAVGTTSFNTLWRLMHGQLLTIQREYSEAKLLLDSIRKEELVTRDLPLVMCDLAWCELNLGNSAAGSAAAQVAEQNLHYLIEPDDKAFVMRRLAQILDFVGNSEHSAHLCSEAGLQLQKHRQFQAELLLRMKSLAFSHEPYKNKPGFTGSI